MQTNEKFNVVRRSSDDSVKLHFVVDLKGSKRRHWGKVLCCHFESGNINEDSLAKHKFNGIICCDLCCCFFHNQPISFIANYAPKQAKLSFLMTQSKRIISIK